MKKKSHLITQQTNQYGAYMTKSRRQSTKKKKCM